MVLDEDAVEARGLGLDRDLGQHSRVGQVAERRQIYPVSQRHIRSIEAIKAGLRALVTFVRKEVGY